MNILDRFSGVITEPAHAFQEVSGEAHRLSFQFFL